jgi:hypothetical protein
MGQGVFTGPDPNSSAKCLPFIDVFHIGLFELGAVAKKTKQNKIDELLKCLPPTE